MKRNRIHKLTFVIPVLLITVLATFFHFRVHYEDALTNLPAADFEVQIAYWRIFFEPVLGLLLFFNRSIYALQELILASLWVIVLYLVFGVVSIIRSDKNRKGKLLRKIANLPLIIGLCFTVFVIILFAPLPNNTIENNSKKWVLVTTHAHTEFSHDGLISQKAMWEWHRKNEFDAFFITDHANHQKSLQFSEEQRRGKLAISPLVLVGQEYSGTNHMSLLGLQGNFKTKGLSDKQVIDSVHRYGGAVVVNHWFDGKGKSKDFYRDLGVDGFEIENVGKALYYDRNMYHELIAFCEMNHLTMIGGLDFHGYGRVCSLYNAFEIPNWKALDPIGKERALINILRNRAQEKVRILMYKDRPYYTSSFLLFRPFLTFVNYFRTLNFYQVISWAFWLWAIQFVWNKKGKKRIEWNKLLLILTSISGLFLIFMAVAYSLKDEILSGYTELYSEYATIMGSAGALLFSYSLVLAYLRIFKLNYGKNTKN